MTALGGGASADARGALWIEDSKCLVVADIHLGYAWVQRRRGQMLPVDAPDPTIDRLVELQSEYGPEQIVFLGDLVHAAVGLEPLRALLTHLVNRLSPGSRLICLLGNHDRNLPARLAEWALPIEVCGQLLLGKFRLTHGDVVPPELVERIGSCGDDTVWFVGHDHPCVILGDGSISALRVPCFLEGRHCLILPAFSPWASGCVVGQRPLSGPVAAAQKFDRVIACVGERLLSIPLQKLGL